MSYQKHFYHFISYCYDVADDRRKCTIVCDILNNGLILQC